MIEVDVHTHLAPINSKRLGDLNGVQWDAASSRLTLDGHTVGVKDLFFADRLISWLDQNRIERALVSIPPPLYRQGLSGDDALTWTTYVNETMLEIIAPYKGRLEALFYVPLEHAQLIESLLNVYRGGGYAGVALAAGGHPGIVYSNAEYQSLWQCLDETKSFVFIHPGTCNDPRLAPYYLENLVGNPYETAVAASHLIMAGVPKSYPSIKFCLAHAGGAFPCLCGRLERGFLTNRPGIDVANIEPPLQAARRFYVDNIAHNDAALDLAREIFGPDKILYGSDWPFPMGLKPINNPTEKT